MQAKRTPKRIPNTRRDTGIRSTCERCSREFAPKRQTQGRFCSRECYWAWWGEHQAAANSSKGLARLESLKSERRDPRSTLEVAWKRKMAYRNTALQMAPETPDEDDLDWAERGEYWESEARPRARTGFPRHGSERSPLVLAGHGVRMRIHYGALVVRHGFTHYPQECKEERLFPGDPRLPSRIILVDPDGFITIDVVTWLARQEIPLVVLDWRGRVVNAVGWTPAAAEPDLRTAQMEAIQNGLGLQIATQLVRQKLSESIRTLQTLPTGQSVHRAVSILQAHVADIRDSTPTTVDALRLIEARAASAYFGAWQGMEVRWTGTGRRPIPPEWRRTPGRQAFGGTNRHASHPVGAMLNYGYGVVESAVRTEIARVGVDPSIGYLHSMRPGRAALVYDLMEPERPRLDRVILGLLRSRSFSPGDFGLNASGVCRLHPQLARVVALGAGKEAVGPATAQVRDWLGGRVYRETDPPSDQ